MGTMSGRRIQRFQQTLAAVVFGLAVALALPSVGLASSEPARALQQPPMPPPVGLTPEQQQAFLESVGQQILQGAPLDPAQREMIQGLIAAVRSCLLAELGKGSTLADAAEACADVVQEAISPGSGMMAISPEDQRWLAQADAGMRNRGRNQGWSEKDINNASLLTTGCIARFLKAGASKEEGLQKCSFAFTIWREAREVANALNLP
jgi:hypothetical protein